MIGLDWIGLDWIGLDWIGLDWIGLDWIGLDWIGLDWIGLHWIDGVQWYSLPLVANSPSWHIRCPYPWYLPHGSYAHGRSIDRSYSRPSLESDRTRATRGRRYCVLRRLLHRHAPRSVLQRRHFDRADTGTPRCMLRNRRRQWDRGSLSWSSYREVVSLDRSQNQSNQQTRNSLSDQ